MSVGRTLKRGVQAALPPTLFLALVAYFLWNATQGDRGLQAMAIREQQFKAAQAELDRVTADEKAWTTRVAGLRSQHLDPDTLDERGRAMLNLADPSDIVVMYGAGKKLF